jgi:hypothetical protein
VEKIMKCPEFKELLDLVENKMSASKRATVNSHIKECAKCAGDRAWAERTFQAMKASSQLYDAPEYAIRKATGLLTPKQALGDWVLAELSFDSWLSPEATGVRSASPGPRQYEYRTDAYSIHLMMDPAGKQARVTGQLVANRPDAVATHCLVELADSKSVLRQVSTGRNGEFAFEAPTRRKLQLKIHGDPESVLLSCRF